MSRKTWKSSRPKECQLCSKSLEGLHFVDGAMIMGLWLCMCISCHSENGIGLGTGRGQEYNEKNEKVAG